MQMVYITIFRLVSVILEGTQMWLLLKAKLPHIILCIDADRKTNPMY